MCGILDGCILNLMILAANLSNLNAIVDRAVRSWLEILRNLDRGLSTAGRNTPLCLAQTYAYL